MKKIVTLLVTMLACITCFALYACEKEPDKPDNGLETEYKSTITVDLYDDAMITSGLASPSWSSSDSDVATATDGKVIALKVGEAVVSAKSGEETEKYLVKVVDNGERPSLDPIVDIESLVESRGKFMPRLTFKGKDYTTEASFDYIAEKDGILTIANDGSYEAAGVGKTTVTVKASWRGVEAAYVSRNVTVTIKEDMVLFANKSEVKDIYSIASFEGSNYKNFETITLSLTVKGTDTEIGEDFVTWESSDESVAAVEKTSATTAKITGKKQGSAIVTAKYTLNGSVTDTEISVDVSLAVADKTLTESYIEKTATAIPDSMLNLFSSEQPLVSVTDVTGETKKTVYDGYTVTLADYGERTLLFSNGVCGYRSVVSVVSKAISTPQEFLNLFNYLESSFKSVNNQHLFTFKGYIVLTANLDFTNYTDYKPNCYSKSDNRRGFGFICDSDFVKEKVKFTGTADINKLQNLAYKDSYASNYGFVGTFDGKGHTIKGLKIAALGIFPSIASGSTVKNVSFINTSIAAEGNGLAAHNNGTIDNVYMQIDSCVNTLSAAGLVQYSEVGSVIKNTVVKFASIGYISFNVARFGVFARTYRGGTVENAYGIGSSNGTKLFGNADSGVTMSTANTSNFFDSEAAYKSGTKNYTNFNTAYWNLPTDGSVPSFKSNSGTFVAYTTGA